MKLMSASNRVKTERLEALHLVRLFRAGELTPSNVSDEAAFIASRRGGRDSPHALVGFVRTYTWYFRPSLRSARYEL